ncbi:hypothetical protein [Brachyspira murdochii]
MYRQTDRQTKKYFIKIINPTLLFLYRSVGFLCLTKKKDIYNE